MSSILDSSATPTLSQTLLPSPALSSSCQVAAEVLPFHSLTPDTLLLSPIAPHPTHQGCRGCLSSSFAGEGSSLGSVLEPHWCPQAGVRPQPLRGLIVSTVQRSQWADQYIEHLQYMIHSLVLTRPAYFICTGALELL